MKKNMEETSGETIQRDIPTPRTAGCDTGDVGEEADKLQKHKNNEKVKRI